MMDGRRVLCFVPTAFPLVIFLVVLGAAPGGLAWALVFGSRAVVPIADSAFTGDLEAGDLDGDGHLDIAAITGSWGGPGVVSLLRGRGDGGFDLIGALSSDASYQQLSIGDLDGDGAVDIAATAHQTADPTRGLVAVFPGRGDGTFGAALEREVSPPPGDVIIEDLDGDGNADLALTAGTAPGAVLALAGNGDGTFGPEKTLPAGPNPRRIAAGRLNADQRVDLVVANFGFGWPVYRGDVSTLLARGRGAFRSGMVLGEPGDALTVLVGDLNADGHQDLAALCTFEQGPTEVGRVVVHLGRSNGTMETLPIARTAFLAVDLALGDFNADGLVDAVVSGAVDIWLHSGRGDGTFDPAVVISGDRRPGRLAPGDFDEDGRLDLAAGVTGGVLILLNPQGG